MKRLLGILSPLFSPSRCPTERLALTSQPKEPVHLGCFVLAWVLSRASHVFQRHPAHKVHRLGFCGFDGAVEYLPLFRVEASEHAAALVGWYLQAEVEEPLTASDGHKHSALQVETCKRSQLSTPVQMENVEIVSLISRTQSIVSGQPMSKNMHFITCIDDKNLDTCSFEDTLTQPWTDYTLHCYTHNPKEVPWLTWCFQS